MRNYRAIVPMTAALLCLGTPTACSSDGANALHVGEGDGGAISRGGAAGATSSGGTSSGGTHTGGTNVGGAGAGSTNVGGAGAGSIDVGGAGAGGIDVGGAGGVASTAREVGYLAAYIGGVSTFSIDPSSGRPTLLPGSPIRAHANAASFAVDPARTFVYVADADRHVYTHRIGTDGALEPDPAASAELPDVPIAMALDPQGRFAYVASSSGRAIYAFGIDSAAGVLTPSGTPVPVGDATTFEAPVFVAVDPTGTFVYVSATGIHGYRIDPSDGTLSELDGSPFGATAPAVGGAIVFAPSGHFLFTSGGGLNAFAVDSDTGALTVVPGSPFTLDVRSDANAPNIAIDPQGKYVYATRFDYGGDVSGFAVDADTGVLTPVPGSPLTDDAPYSISVDPSGRFVFVGDDLPTTTVYAIDRSSGRLSELPDSPFPFGGLESKLFFATLP